MYVISKNKEMLGFELLSKHSNIFHFTTTRRGGVSKGSYGAMNLSYYCGDDKAAVSKNWEIVKGEFPFKPNYIAFPYQTHGDKIRIIDASFLELSTSDQKSLLHGVDALITNSPRVLLTTCTADCVPSILYDPIKQVVATVHSGWRGTTKHLLVKVVHKMIEKFGSNPEDILATIGPSISLKAFEVGDEVVQFFKESNFIIADIAYRNPKTGKYHIDLWESNRLLLNKAGVLDSNICYSNQCTYTNYELFFSARRLTIDSGRVTTAVMLKE